MKNIWLGLFLFSFSSLLAQKEYNVKLQGESTALRSYFQANKNQPISQEKRHSQKGTYPFLAEISFIQPLASALPNLYTLTVESPEAIAHMQQTGNFSFIEENHPITLDLLQESSPNDDSIDNQWHHARIQTFQAWDITKGKNTVKVGVIDTGLDYNHPEFSGQLAINSLEDRNQNGTFEPWPSTETHQGQTGDFDGIDQDSNGYVDDVIGYDFTDSPRNPTGGDYLFQDADPLDENKHGTFVSGIIVAKDNNTLGGSGIAPHCKLVTLRAFSADGTGEDDDIARAIVYAADNGVTVLNLSFGDAYPSLMMREAIRYADAKGVAVIASAGNGTGDDLHYPSNFDEVISVSATVLQGDSEYLWQLSSYGWAVALAAPGGNIFSTTLRDSIDGKWVEYTYASGTSASAPMVAAAACLLRSQRPELTPQQIRNILCNGADDVMDAGWDAFTGAGRLNIYQSLQTVGGGNVRILSPINDAGSNRDTIYIVGTVLEPEFESFSIEYQAGTESSPAWTPIVNNQTLQVANDTLAKWVLTGLPEGAYTIRLKAQKTDGFTIEDRVRYLRDKSLPEIKISVAHPIWDNQDRKMYIAFRVSDVGIHTLHFREVGTETFHTISTDKMTKNGEFLIGNENLTQNEYEYFISSRNGAGLVGQTPLQVFSHFPQQIEQSGYSQLSAMLPMGAFVPDAFDFDNDGQKEAVFSQYSERLSFGKIKFYEYQGLSGFQSIDSITLKNVLIPKSIADADNDGKLDFLCSVNDSSFIFSPSATSPFPTTLTWSKEGGQLYASRFADTDNNNIPEVLMKDFKDYYILQRNGANYVNLATLADVSGNYQGSIAPRALVADFDGDNQSEIVFGDYDGDFVIYEYEGNSSYALRYVDSLEARQKSGEYLVQGDFDGDGKEEFFVATHLLPGLRNADKEYDPNYLHLRIFKATANNTYQKVWEDYLYDVDTDTYNAATASNVDTDALKEIVFTSFPRTYILEYQNGTYQFTWFHYGDICTHHMIGDFNGNGTPEIGIGRGDSTVFYEKITQTNLPQAATTLAGIVLGATSTQLDWQPAPNATSYIILRQENIPNPPSPISVAEVSSPSFIDTNLTPNQEYFYALVSKNAAGESDFGNVILLRPHARVQVDSLHVVTPNQLQVFFTENVTDDDAYKPKFVLDGGASPISLVAQNGKTLLLGFAENFSNGNHNLRIDTTFLDADLGRLSANDTLQPFIYQPNISQTAYLTHWERIDGKEAILHFNLPMNDGILDRQNYRISPYGNLQNITWEGSNRTAVRLVFDNVVLGEVGYTVSVTIENVTALDGSPMMKGEGNTATFSGFSEDLSGIYTYPSPVNISQQNTVEGMYFAKLPQKATIRIMTLSGRHIQQIEETDGNGGVEWNLRDAQGKPIYPGVYLYQVTTPEGTSMIGKFTVVGE